MAKRKSKPSLQQEYNKELKRIKQFIRRATKRGYIFDETIIPPKLSKVSRKQLEAIKQITPTTLYEKAEFENPQTGDIMSGVEGRKLERQKSAYKGQLTKAINASKTNKRVLPKNLPQEKMTVLENVRSMIRAWSPSPTWSVYWEQVKRNHKNSLETLLDSVIAEYGETTVARRLQNSSADIERIVNSILYGSKEEQVQFDLVHFATIIVGHSLSDEDCARYTEQQEGQEDYTQP